MLRAVALEKLYRPHRRLKRFMHRLGAAFGNLLPHIHASSSHPVLRKMVEGARAQFDAGQRRSGEYEYFGKLVGRSGAGLPKHGYARRGRGDPRQAIFLGPDQGVPGFEQTLIFLPNGIGPGIADTRCTLIGAFPIVRQHAFPQRPKAAYRG
jgi:hypothetical protein